MDAKLEKLYEERKNRFITTLSHKEPDVVPICHMAETWNLSYAGVTAAEVENDTEKEFEAFVKPFEEIYSDGVAIPCLSRNLTIWNALGGKAYFYSSDGVTIQHQEYVFMKDDEYDKFIKDPVGFSVKEIFPRKYDVLNKSYPQNVEALKTSLSALNQFTNKYAASVEYHKEKVGMPTLVAVTGSAPFDIILDFFRGFKGTMGDIRRRPQQVKEACEVIEPLILQSILMGNTSMESFPYVFFPLHAPTFLNVKQFETLFWPTYRNVLYKLKEIGAKVMVYLEGDWSHLYDYVNDFPEDFAICVLEKDDIFKAKKKIGDRVALAGGMDLGKLRNATKEQCIDHAKALVDECAPGGGYIFSTDKSLLAPGDVNVENYAAVCEFVHNYGKY